MSAYEHDSDSDVEVIDNPGIAVSTTARPSLPSPPSTRSSHAIRGTGIHQSNGRGAPIKTKKAPREASNDDDYCGLCEVGITVSPDMDPHKSWIRHCCTLRHQQVLNRLNCHANMAEMDEERRRLADSQASVTSSLNPRFPDIREILDGKILFSPYAIFPSLICHVRAPATT